MQEFGDSNAKNFELLREFKNLLNVNSSLINTQKNLFQIVNEKFLKIEYVICKILQNPSSLYSNQNYLKNLFRVDEFLLPSNFYSKLNRFDPLFSEKKLKDIEKRIDRKLNILKSNTKNYKNEISKQFFSENPRRNQTMSDNNKKKTRDLNFFSIQPQNKNYPKKTHKEKNRFKDKDFKILSSSNSNRNRGQENKCRKSDSLLDKSFFLNNSLMKIYNKKPETSTLMTNDYAKINKENLKNNNSCNDTNSLENVNCENDDKENMISLPYDMKKFKISKEGSGQIYSPIKEKKIIKNLMEKAYKDIENNNYHHANRGNIYEVKYVISSDWWKKWLNYVKFYDVDVEETSVQDSFETSPIREEGNFSHPGKIINRDLIDPKCLKENNTKNIFLKDNLLEHLDYEAVPKHIYSHIKKWYGTDYEIIRFMKKNPENENVLYLELYPEKSLQNKKYKFNQFNQRKGRVRDLSNSPQKTEKECNLF